MELLLLLLLLGLGACLLAELMLLLLMLLLLPVLVLLHHEKLLLLVGLLGGVIVKHERPWPWRLHIELLGHRWMHPSSICVRIVHIRSSTILMWLLLLRLKTLILTAAIAASHIDVNLERLLIPMLLLRLLSRDPLVTDRRSIGIRLRSIRVARRSCTTLTFPATITTLLFVSVDYCVMTSP